MGPLCLLSLDGTTAAVEHTLDPGSGGHVSASVPLDSQIADDLFRQTSGLSCLIEGGRLQTDPLAEGADEAVAAVGDDEGRSGRPADPDIGAGEMDGVHAVARRIEDGISSRHQPRAATRPGWARGGPERRPPRPAWARRRG